MRSLRRPLIAAMTAPAGQVEMPDLPASVFASPLAAPGEIALAFELGEELVHFAEHQIGQPPIGLPQIAALLDRPAGQPAAPRGDQPQIERQKRPARLVARQPAGEFDLPTRRQSIGGRQHDRAEHMVDLGKALVWIDQAVEPDKLHRWLLVTGAGELELADTLRQLA